MNTDTNAVKNLSYKFTFVVLNYQCTEETKECIRSIEALDYENKAIVVVDNFSENQDEFFKNVKGEFADRDNVYYLKSFKNTGYARGNNIGIDFAKNVLKSDFVCVINPDVTIPQKEFIDKCFELYDEHRYAVLGPRILSDGRDTSPLGHYGESPVSSLKGTMFDLKLYFVKKFNLGKLNFVKKLRNRKAPDPEKVKIAQEEKKAAAKKSADEIAEKLPRTGTYALSTNRGGRSQVRVWSFLRCFFRILRALRIRPFYTARRICYPAYAII